MLKGEKYGNFSVFICSLIELMKRSVSTDVRMRYAISWDPGCSDDEIEFSGGTTRFEKFENLEFSNLKNVNTR